MTRCNVFFVRNFHGVAFPALPVKTRTQETRGTPRGLHHFFQPKTSKNLKDVGQNLDLESTVESNVVAKLKILNSLERNKNIDRWKEIIIHHWWTNLVKSVANQQKNMTAYNCCRIDWSRPVTQVKYISWLRFFMVEDSEAKKHEMCFESPQW